MEGIERDVFGLGGGKEGGGGGKKMKCNEGSFSPFVPSYHYGYGKIFDLVKNFKIAVYFSEKFQDSALF